MPLPLNDPELSAFIRKAVQGKTEILKLSEALSKSRFKELRGEILDYIALVPKFQKKFDTKALLACDKLAFEQSTAADIARFKAELFRGASSVDDLCSGMGGDSFFLPKELSVRGVDLSEERVAMYRFNTQAMGCERPAEVADVRTLQNRSDFFSIDPARRMSSGDNQRNFSELTPSLSEILDMAKKYKGGMAKLPPGIPTDGFPPDAETLYIGALNDCRECLLLLGNLARHPGKTSAVAIESSGKIHTWTSEIPGKDLIELPKGPLAAYIAEPIPVLIRSHLFAQAALKISPDAHLISPGIAYVTADAPLNSAGFRNFRILGSVPLSTGKVKRLLKEHDIGRITLKKRGVEIVPEVEIQRLSPKGSREGVLFYTRIHGEKAAILTSL